MKAPHAHRPFLHAAALFLLLDLAACGGGGGGGGGTGGGGGGPTRTLSTVAVTSDKGTVDAGTTVQLKATASYSDASTTDVTTQAAWTSSADAVASVSGAGVVSGKAPGSVSVSAAFEGKSGAVSLIVNPPPLTASFSVKTNNPADSDVCRIKSDGDLDCYFDGTASGPDATTWMWTWAQGSKQRGPTSRNSATFEPNTDCNFFDSNAAQMGTGFVQMIVTLRVRDASGRESADRVNNNVRLVPQKRCGFGF
jgi:hypothetical protein